MVKLTKLSKKLTHLVSYFQYWGLLKGQEIYICDQAPKNILYGIIRKKNRLHNLPLDFQIDLFDKVITRNYSCFVIWLGRTRFKKIIDVFECLQFI